MEKHNTMKGAKTRMHYDDAIKFSFPNLRSAYDAFDTLQELGYEPVIDQEGDQPALHIHVRSADVQSALEITQVHGGEMLDTSSAQADYDANQLYAISPPSLGAEGIGVPAHTVNEDFTEDYLTGYSHSYLDE